MSSDTRTLDEKLRAMAEQTESPHEAEIAATKLAARGSRTPPPRPPTAVAAPGFDPWGWNGMTTSGTSAIGSFTIRVTFR